MIPINDNIPAPATAGRPSKYPFRQLKPGESFFVATDKQKSVPVSHWRLATGYKFAIRKVTESGTQGVRIWRLA